MRSDSLTVKLYPYIVDTYENAVKVANDIILDYGYFYCVRYLKDGNVENTKADNIAILLTISKGEDADKQIISSEWMDNAGCTKLFVEGSDEYSATAMLNRIIETITDYRNRLGEIFEEEITK